VETQIAGGILLALFWIAIMSVAIKMGFGFINLLFDSALFRWGLLGIAGAIYYVTHNGLWATVWSNAYWLWLGPLLAAMVGGVLMFAWEALVRLYRFLQWAERLWDTYPQWRPFKPTARPWGQPRAPEDH
jgi:hypothetical protein